MQSLFSALLFSYQIFVSFILETKWVQASPNAG